MNKWVYYFLGYSRLNKTLTLYINLNGKELIKKNVNNWIFASTNSLDLWLGLSNEN